MQQNKPQQTQVQITCIPAMAEVHGWKVGSIVSTVMPLTDFIDSDGNTIYVHSPLRNRSVNLIPGEYKKVG